VVVAADGGPMEEGASGTNDGSDGKAAARLRTSPDFVNARLIEAGLPLGSSRNTSSTSLDQHAVSTGRFIRDLEGTGCYDAVKIHIGEKKNGASANEQQHQAPPLAHDVTIQLQEKKWYKLYIGGGVNSDDLSSLGTNTNSGSNNAFGSLAGLAGSSGGTATGAALSALPKLQFETSASLLNLTGFADISSASYSVDQTGSSTFRFAHDRPLVSYLSKENALYQWLMPMDPRTIVDIENGEDADNAESLSLDESQIYNMDDAQYSLGGGSHTSLGMHATCHNVDYESTRSTKEFVRSAGIRLANHARGAARQGGAGGGYRPSMSPPESMAGPYVFLDWNASLRDVLPKRSSSHPFVLDCSPQVARQAGTYLKHSLTSGMYLNGCFVDDRYDPTMGYDAHVVGEVAGPPGDVGYCKLKGGYSWHFPVELLRMMVLGVNSDDEYNDDVAEDEDVPSSVIGMTLHSSFNCGVIRPLTFNGLVGNTNNTAAAAAAAVVPFSDRFYIGGPGQLRGFLPSGIGPRANKGGSSVPGGDALGGDLFYTSTLATSIPFPSYFSTLRQNGARIFGFANAGTCVSCTSSSSGGLLGGAGTGGGIQSSPSLLGLGCIPVWSQILQSTRVAVGGGVSVGSPMGRFEATYAVPLRYGPRDARKSVQFGFGFSFG